MSGRPLGVKNTPQFVQVLLESTFRTGWADQYLREFVENAIQADATQVIITGVRLDYYDDQMNEEGGLKVAFVDNGVSMTPAQVLNNIGDLGSGQSTLGVDKNFQMGSRVSALPFNEDGIIYAVFRKGNPKGTMMRLCYNAEEGVYEAYEWFDADGNSLGYTPEADAYLKHPIIKKAGQGTVVVLCGNSHTDNTFGEITRNNDGTFTFPSKYNQRYFLRGLISRYYRFGNKLNKLQVLWSGSDYSKFLPEPGAFVTRDMGLNEGNGGNARYRNVESLETLLSGDNYQDRGEVDLVDGNGTLVASVVWALVHDTDNLPQKTLQGTWNAFNEKITLEDGMFGELYADEVYNPNYRGHGDPSTYLGQYGIFGVKTRKRVTLLVKPVDRSPSGKIIAAPDSPRRRLTYGNSGQLPHNEWGALFQKVMPAPIKEAQKKELSTVPESTSKSRNDVRNNLLKFFTKLAPSTKKSAPKGQAGDAIDGRGLSGSGDGGAFPGSGNSDGGGTKTGAGPSWGRRKPTTGSGEGARSTRGSRNIATTIPDVTVTTSSAQFVDEPEKLVLCNGNPSIGYNIFINDEHPYYQKLMDESSENRAPEAAVMFKNKFREGIETNLYAYVVSVLAFNRSVVAGAFGASNEMLSGTLNDYSLSGWLVDRNHMLAIASRAVAGRAGAGK